MTKIGSEYKVTTDRDGKTRLVLDEKAKSAKLDLCARLKKRNSKRQTWKPAGRGKQCTNIK